MENSNQLRTWLDDMQLDHPLLIAGPCSAETESQVLEIAHQSRSLRRVFFFTKQNLKPNGLKKGMKIRKFWTNYY